jgi:hypothetical protein
MGSHETSWLRYWWRSQREIYSFAMVSRVKLLLDRYRSRFPVIIFLIIVGVFLLCVGDLSTPAFSAGPTFLDVPSDHPYYEYIEALYQNGYVAGCSSDPMMYCPGRVMDRAESAVFIERGIHGAEHLPTQPTEVVFADVALSQWYAKWTHGLWEDGYTAGCGKDPLIYCPDQDHTRAEGCVFYLRMMYGADYEPPQGPGYFEDVDPSQWYADWVDACWEAGIAEPCGTEPLQFCPEDGLTRAVAAYMMVQAKEIPLPTPTPTPPPTQGNVIHAVSCSQEDVQAAINAASNGDTVRVPAGNCTWTTTVTIPNTKGINLIGAGIGKTNIEDGTPVDGANTNTALYIHNSEGKPFRVSGFTFTDGDNADWRGVIGMNGTCKNFRIDHCRFEALGQRAIFGSGDMWGLIDNCEFMESGHQVINFNSVGDTEWNRPLSLGTAQAVYIEDCLFERSAGSTGFGIIDVHNGGRFVIRKNTIINHTISTHHADMEEGFRGVHSYEIYWNNWFVNDMEIWSVLPLRGGSGVIYENNFFTANGGLFYHIINPVNYCVNDRSCVSRHMSYPALDQIGRTTGQILEPLREWENALYQLGNVDDLLELPLPPEPSPFTNGQDLDVDTYFSADLNDCCNCDTSPQAACGTSPCTSCFIREGRDYFNDAQKPGYTPYTYPHPLRNE